MTADPDPTPTARPDAHERAEVEQERWPMDLPLVPCSGCGSTAASKHVYGVRKCCPDCSHDLAAHDAQVRREAKAEALREARVSIRAVLDDTPLLRGLVGINGGAQAMRDFYDESLTELADRIEREGGEGE